MAEKFGLTPQGLNIKRMDQILDGLHTKLSERWGVNTRQNPQSFLGVHLTGLSEEIAELWELGADVYFSQYPSTAEGASLDNAIQYGGTTREQAMRSYYPIHCTGTDGTKLAAGTMISSNMNPSTNLILVEDKQITRSAFNRAEIKIATLSAGDIYTVAIDGAVFSFVSKDVDAEKILKGIAAAITAPGFKVTVNEKTEILSLEAEDVNSTNALILSDNLTTHTVTTILTFGTVDTGDILLPDGVITNIVKADVGLLKVENRCGYIAGRDEETDAEVRKSYTDKIFSRSSRMIEAIRSAILENVQGVTSVAGYENPSHEFDDKGRPPHCVEMVVDGGDSKEIAEQILANKASGIRAFGDTQVVVPGEYGEDITIGFNRPAPVYTWFHLGLTISQTEAMPPNYVDLLRAVILEKMDALDAGKNVVPQQFASDLHKACSGIDYIDIKLFATEDASVSPDDYPDRSVVITARQRAVTSEEMIEVVIDG